MKGKSTIALVSLLAIIAGCASKPPESIASLSSPGPGLEQVLQDVDAHLGREVRWGGVITRVENKADATWIELVRYPLNDNGRPQIGYLSDGRFIARFERFVDPLVYEKGRPLTVVGSIDDKLERPIGEFEYLFPVVSVQGSHLWQAEKQKNRYHNPPYWGYYSPYYPFSRFYFSGHYRYKHPKKFRN